MIEWRETWIVWKVKIKHSSKIIFKKLFEVTKPRFISIYKYNYYFKEAKFVCEFGCKYEVIFGITDLILKIILQNKKQPYSV